MTGKIMLRERERERGEDEEEKELLGFWGFPSAHLETEKWTFSRVRASDLWGSLRQFLTRFAHMFEYVMYVIPAALQNGTAAFDAIFFLSSLSLTLTFVLVKDAYRRILGVCRFGSGFNLITGL